MSEAIHLASKVKGKDAKKWAGDLRPYLVPGEAPVMLSRTSHLKPMFDVLALTTTRVIGFASAGTSTGLRMEMSLGEIKTAEVRSRMGSKTLHLISTAGEDVSFGTLPSKDADDVLDHMRQAIEQGPDAQVQARVASQRLQSEDAWASMRLVGKEPSAKARKMLEQHCAPGEAPWFLLHSSGAGVLAAFADRCMIIKTGAVTSLMAGSFGGARITTFPYREITAVEYNSGMLSGVLEILTASYQGSANKDFWRGTLSPRNANSNDPYTLSNTLPLPKAEYAEALPYLNQMRELVTKSREHPAVSTSSAAPERGGLTEDLSALAALHASGALTDAEFAEAKRQAIARHQP